MEQSQSSKLDANSILSDELKQELGYNDDR
jgi:hypothetical protein